MRSSRAALLVAGIGLVGVGAVEAWRALGIAQLVGMAVWLAGAIALHDALLAPGGAVLSRALERRGAALAPASRGVIRVCFVVGVVLTLITVPAIVAQSRGTLNPTVLTRPYAAVLAGVWLGLAVLTALGVLVAQRRSTVRSS